MTNSPTALWRWALREMFGNCLSSFPLLRHDINVSCKPVGISGSWITAIRNSIGDYWKRVFVRPPVMAESSAWLTVQTPNREPETLHQQSTRTYAHCCIMMKLLFDCDHVAWDIDKERERERDNVFGPMVLSSWVLEEFILRFFFSQQKLCSRLNNSSAFQCLWVLFMWMVRDSVDRGFFSDGETSLPCFCAQTGIVSHHVWF